MERYIETGGVICHGSMSNDGDFMRWSVLDTNQEYSEHTKDKSEENSHPEDIQYVDDNINDDTMMKEDIDYKMKDIEEVKNIQNWVNMLTII